MIPHGACLVGTVANSPQRRAINRRKQCFVTVGAGGNINYAAVVAKISRKCHGHFLSPSFVQNRNIVLLSMVYFRRAGSA